MKIFSRSHHPQFDLPDGPDLAKMLDLSWLGNHNTRHIFLLKGMPLHINPCKIEARTKQIKIENYYQAIDIDNKTKNCVFCLDDTEKNMLEDGLQIVFDNYRKFVIKLSNSNSETFPPKTISCILFKLIELSKPMNEDSCKKISHWISEKCKMADTLSKIGNLETGKINRHNNKRISYISNSDYLPMLIIAGVNDQLEVVAPQYLTKIDGDSNRSFFDLTWIECQLWTETASNIYIMTHAGITKFAPIEKVN